MTPNAYTQIFSSLFPFWDKLPAHEQELLYKSTLPVSYKKGQIIHDGTECTGMILVQKFLLVGRKLVPKWKKAGENLGICVGRHNNSPLSVFLTAQFAYFQFKDSYHFEHRRVKFPILFTGGVEHYQL